ncbi:hypothetical protein SAY86_021697 [Trapa natans]|uniref:Uncharacterized protein n=1 Tax=Trapa natans TaxID=22666 RepID=A0AAN7M8G5_TRANT|nr:hypothetical protein SAY86_021697 [Trapa natans]
MLQTVPSFSVFTSVEDDGDCGEAGEERDIHYLEKLEAKRADQGEDGPERTVTMGDCIAATAGGSDFSFESGKDNMGLIKEEKEEDDEEEFVSITSLNSRQEDESFRPLMCLATGFEMDNIDLGSSLELVIPNFDSDEDMEEEYYKRMINDFPSHPLLLRNYAQFLQRKGKFDGAEEYFLQATLADPDSAELLIQYAQFLWDVRHDQERALAYFESATQIVPADSNILAAYARFVWEVEGESETDGPGEGLLEETQDELRAPKTGEEMENRFLNIVVDPENGLSTEDEYKKMVEKDPLNPSLLKNYARFLHETKGEHQGAEEMYLRAIRADPSNGEAMALYATLVWQLYRDFRKASHYFEQAAQVNPQDSEILGAYASFVWEAGGNEDGEESRDSY